MRFPRHKLFSRSFPELRLFTSAADRERAYRYAAQGCNTWRFVIIAIGLVPLMIVLIVSVRFLLTGRVPHLVVDWAVPAMSGALVCAAWINSTRRHVQRRLREALCEAGIPVCIRCGYQLAGLSAPRCPECGADFDARLIGGEPGGDSSNRLATHPS